MTNQYQPRCPNCGKYQQTDAHGYYAKLIDDAGVEIDRVEIFCSSDCHSRYVAKRPVIHITEG